MKYARSRDGIVHRVYSWSKGYVDIALMCSRRTWTMRPRFPEDPMLLVALDDNATITCVECAVSGEPV